MKTTGMALMLLVAAGCSDRTTTTGHTATSPDAPVSRTEVAAPADAPTSDTPPVVASDARYEVGWSAAADGLGPADGATGEIGADGANAAADGGSDFCSGSAPKMVVNGGTSTPMVTSRPIVMDCCDGEELLVSTADFEYPISVDWIRQVGPNPAFPATVDLANIPKGWTVEVLIGCPPKLGRCYPPPDSYSSGLQGSLRVARGTSGYVTSLCLHAAEPSTGRHPIVHSLDLYVPGLSSP